MSPLSLRRLSDERLSGRLASGEAAAFDELYRRYVHRLAAYGGHLLGDAAAGEDVAHVALMNAYQALRAGKLPTHVRPWLYRIAHNAAVDSLTRRRELPIADVRTADEEDTRSQPAARGALLAALAALPERQRRAYVLRELHGLKVAEVAAELTLSVQQVEQALFSARNRMTELLVFGERLTCETARRLAVGPLDWAERKAVRSHARSCQSCRSALGARAAAVGLLPALDWLRGLASAAAGGGGGVAVAKVGAAAATATLVAGIPAAGDLARQSERTLGGVPRVDPAAPRVAPPRAPRVARMLAAEDTAGTATRRREDRHEGGSRGRDGSSETAARAETRHGRDAQERPGSTTSSESGDRADSGRTTTTSTEIETSGSSVSSVEGSPGSSSPGSSSPGSSDSGSSGSGSGDSVSGDSVSGDSGQGGGSSGPG